MSFKHEIETWVKAVGQYDNHEFEEALQTFQEIADTAKILFNCGVIHATLGQHHKAVECYQRAIKRDNYLAIAYFQQGVSNFLVGDFEEALANFNDTLIYLRGNRFINYDQLGLKYKLYSCAVLFNRGLCYVYLQQKEVGMKDLRYAAMEKETEEHDVIDEAIQEEAEGYTVFSIGVGTLYRPNAAKVKNLKSKDYLGKPRLIAAAEQSNTYMASSDPKKAALAAATERAPDDRPAESISYAASNLIKPGLHSRSRQQSAPPVNRNMFPPTPPPESENRSAFMQASSPPLSEAPIQRSIHTQPSHPLRPEPLKLQKSSFTSLNTELPRIGTTRTASEPRGPTRRTSYSRDQQQPRRLAFEASTARPHSGGDADIDEYPEELLEMDPSLRKKPSQSSSITASTSATTSTDQIDRPHRPSSRTRQRNRSQSRQRRHNRTHDQHPSIEEEDETAVSGGELTGSSVDGFEMLHNAGGGLSQPGPHPMPVVQLQQPPRASSRPRRPSSTNRGARPHSRRPGVGSRNTSYTIPDPELTSLRIKVHHADDTRYIMLSTDTPFETFTDRVREKFRLGDKGFKVKVRDEGDLITMGDRDDWDMAVAAAKREMVAAWRKKVDEEGSAEGIGEEGGMGKMEVWVHEVVASMSL